MKRRDKENANQEQEPEQKQKPMPKRSPVQEQVQLENFNQGHQHEHERKLLEIPNPHRKHQHEHDKREKQVQGLESHMKQGQKRRKLDPMVETERLTGNGDQELNRSRSPSHTELRPFCTSKLESGSRSRSRSPSRARLSSDSLGKECQRIELDHQLSDEGTADYADKALECARLELKRSPPEGEGGERHVSASPTTSDLATSEMRETSFNLKRASTSHQALQVKQQFDNPPPPQSQTQTQSQLQPFPHLTSPSKTQTQLYLQPQPQIVSSVTCGSDRRSLGDRPIVQSMVTTGTFVPPENGHELFAAQTLRFQML